MIVLLWYLFVFFIHSSFQGEENGFLSKMEKMAAKGARQFDLSRISNSTLLRMLKKLMDVGYVDDRHLMDKVLFERISPMNPLF